MVPYFTKRRGPNKTEYHFNLEQSELGNWWITVTRLTKFYLPTDVILRRRFISHTDALEEFQTLLDKFPEDRLYKE